MARIINTNVYAVIVKEKRGKRCAGVWTFESGTNICAELRNIGNVVSAEVYTSKKLAMNEAEDKNKSYMMYGNYAYADSRKRYGA